MPSETVSVNIGEETFEVPPGVFLHTVFDKVSEKRSSLPIVAALMNNVLSSLSEIVDVNCDVVPVYPDVELGADIYRRSLSFLLAIANAKVFPDRRILISHSLGHCFFYSFPGQTAVSPAECNLLKRKMDELVSQDLPIQQRRVNYVEAVHWFREHGMDQSLAYLENLNEPRAIVNQCAGYMDLRFRPIVHCTGILGRTELIPYRTGFVMLYPSKTQPLVIPSFRPLPHLYEAYMDHKRVSSIMDVECIGDLNRLIRSDKVRDYLLVNETLHTKKIAEICSRITHEHRLILISGPSSSGKTTFAKRIQVQLRAMGRKPVLLGMDDYFVNREDTPKDENGKYDFECVEALDLERFNSDVARLTAGELVETPRFDFHTGKRVRGETLQMDSDGIMICEGIHGLNPIVSKSVGRAQKYMIYICPLSQLNIDDHARVNTTETRLLRRIVRDARTRGWTATDTIRQWPSVRLGENKHILPFSHTADVLFNSALDYETAVIAPFARAALLTVPPDSLAYPIARLLLDFLEHFLPINPELVPPNSLLREFIGNSAFRY